MVHVCGCRSCGWEQFDNYIHIFGVTEEYLDNIILYTVYLQLVSHQSWFKYTIASVVSYAIIIGSISSDYNLVGIIMS